MLTVSDVARICHEANRALCATMEDLSQLPWEEAPLWQINSAIDGVRFHLANPLSTAAESHNNWLQHNRAEGWTCGPVKDPAKKEHPCMVPFIELPLEQQAKDHLFVATVRALAFLVVPEHKPI